MKKFLPDWLIDSNRYKHLVGIALVAVVTFAMLALLYLGHISWQHFVIVAFVSVAVSAAMEFKDVHHYNGDHVPFRKWDWSPWDWLDIVSGMIGYLAVAVVVLVLCICLT